MKRKKNIQKGAISLATSFVDLIVHTSARKVSFRLFDQEFNSKKHAKRKIVKWKTLTVI